MGVTEEKQDEKSQLATQICAISTRAIACANSHRTMTKNSPFINWYLVLKVDENADVYDIKKQYRQLALQLHPDKNKNSNAETAFKLVSEAYFWLSDSARRATFDSERQKTTPCIKCNINSTKTKILKPHRSSSRIQNHIKELRTKLKDEANVIEKCLLTASRIQLAKSAHGQKKELPVFNPADYYSQVEGWPKDRTATNDEKMESLRNGFRMRNRCINDGRMDGSPVFPYRRGRVPFMSRCARSGD